MTRNSDRPSIAPPFAKEWRYYRYVYAVIILLSVVAFFLLAWNNTFEWLFAVSRAHEEWQVDELLWLFFVGTFALLATLLLDRRRLTVEITRRRTAEDAVRSLASFDTVTGAPNRSMFLKMLGEQVAAAREHGTRVALLVIDIDHFMAINDRLGHEGGDLILQAVSGRLRAALRPRDQVGRLGSDEFAVLCPLGARDGVNELFRLAERILSLLHGPFETGAGSASLTASIGIAKFPRDASDEKELLLDAESALLQAKTGGRNRYVLFDSSLDAKRRERLGLEAEFRSGLVCGEIIAFYQPLVRLTDREPVGAEALARWRHPARGLLSPGAFVDMAQDIGLIGELLDCMLKRVCEDTLAWPAHLTVAVNISPQQLVDKDLATAIFAILDAYGYPPERLEVEITETALLLDFDAARSTMAALKDRGVRLSLDDFGTGYSSLTHLHQLPFDKLKIDRTFTQGVLEDGQSRKITSSIISLSHALNLVTVAEGVETMDQAEWLREQGCDLAQGFYFAKPMPAEDAARLMAAAPPIRAARREG